MQLKKKKMLRMRDAVFVLGGILSGHMTLQC